MQRYQPNSFGVRGARSPLTDGGPGLKAMCGSRGRWTFRAHAKGLVCLAFTAAALLGWREPADARPCRSNLIPNGSARGCENCHSGNSLTPFGALVRTGVTPGSCAEFWGPEVAGVDSDGDGRTNGQELGDPDGSWRPGAPAPGVPALVSNPGVREDHGCATISVDQVSGSTPLEVAFRGEFGDCVGDGSKEYDWDFDDGEIGSGQEVVHTYRQAGLYTPRLTVTLEGGAAFTGEVTIAATCTGEPVTPWTLANVGETLWRSCARPRGEGIEIHGGGRGFYRSADELSFAHLPLRGDFSVTARIADVAWEDGAACGILVRASTATDALSYAACVILRNGVAHPYAARRTAPGDRARTRTVSAVDLEAPGVWVRLDRSGDQFTAFTSPHGEEWFEFDAWQITDMPDDVLAGLTVSSGEVTMTARVTFDSVSGFGMTPEFLRGDSNDDGRVDISDALNMFNWLFSGGVAPGCPAATNVNGDGAVNIADPISLLNHLFADGPAPVVPYPDCGAGTLAVDAEIGCANPPNCQ